MKETDDGNGPMRSATFRAAVACNAILLLCACESIVEMAKTTDTLLHETAGTLTKVDKVTGRRSLNLDTKQREYERGASTFAQILSDPTKVGAQPGATPVPATDPRYRRLERIFARIVSASHAADESGTSAEFALIDDPQWNALALGGNKTVFFTGLTESLNDDELAAVVGHELAHNTAAHISEHAAARIVSLATERGRKKGWSEAYTYKHEQEADDLGILYAALAGYDPYGAAALWKKRADSGYEWFRTHPTSAERARRNKETAGKVRQYYRPGRVNPEAKAVLDCNVVYCQREALPLKPGSGGGLVALAEAIQSIRQQYKEIKNEWKRQKDEIGRQSSRDDGRYEGARQNGAGYRRGEWSSPDGHRYVGEFLNEEFHGKGVYYWPDGERYDGEFRQGEFRGIGEWTMTNGERYIGEVRNGKFHGCGSYIWPDGEFYAGEFKNDKFYGLGSYVWPDGDMETCDWRDDKEISGSCIEHRIDGPLPEKAKTVCFRRAAWRDSLPGNARKNENPRVESRASRSDAQYGGNYKNGVMRAANGDIYASMKQDGAFDSRGLQGCGAYVGANGDRYIGQFRDGRFHGRGTYEWKNGRGATCGWRAGEPVEGTCIAHEAVGIGKRDKGDGVCASLGDSDLLKMEKRRREKECLERFGKGSAKYKDCRARVRVLGISDLRVRKP